MGHEEVKIIADFFFSLGGWGVAVVKYNSKPHIITPL